MGRRIFHLLLLVGLVVFWNHPVKTVHAYSSSPKPRGGRGNSDNNKSPNSRQERTVVLLYHKPANVVTSHVAEDSRPTVYDEIQSMKGFVLNAAAAGSDKTNGQPIKSSPSFEEVTGIRSKLHAIGRLDADTTGLLLLTNDGGLVHHVTNPQARQFRDGTCPTTTSTVAVSSNSHLITKTYEALIMGHHDATSLSPLWEGVDIGSKYGGMTRPVDNIHILDHPNHKSTLVSITISEGRNRQVRRMFHALGSGVMKLKRVKIGNHLSIEGLHEQEWRILSEQEVLTGLGWATRTLTTVSTRNLQSTGSVNENKSSSKTKQPPSWMRKQEKRR